MTIFNLTRGKRTFPFFVRKARWDGKESTFLYFEVLYIYPSGRAIGGITYHFDGKTTEDLWTGDYTEWQEIKPEVLKELKKRFEKAKLSEDGEKAVKRKVERTR